MSGAWESAPVRAGRRWSAALGICGSRPRARAGDGGSRLDPCRIFTGNASRKLGQAICDWLKTPLGEAEVSRFEDGEVSVRFTENIRGSDVFIVQATGAPAENLMELLVMLDAAKRASARRVTAVLPYFGYARQDRKDQPRAPISAKLVANLIERAGVDRVMTVDLHAGQIQGFFSIPVDELTALYILANYFTEKRLNDAVVVAADLGATKRARNFAERLDLPLAIIEKRRAGNRAEAEALSVIGDVRGMQAIIVDDEVDTGGSLVQGARILELHGAREIYACCTHGMFSGPAIDRIEHSCLAEVVTTDTVPLRRACDRITVLPVAPLLGEAIRRIHDEESVSTLFV